MFDPTIAPAPKPSVGVLSEASPEGYPPHQQPPRAWHGRISTSHLHLAKSQLLLIRSHLPSPDHASPLDRSSRSNTPGGSGSQSPWRSPSRSPRSPSSPFSSRSAACSRNGSRASRQARPPPRYPVAATVVGSPHRRQPPPPSPRHAPPSRPTLMPSCPALASCAALRTRRGATSPSWSGCGGSGGSCSSTSAIRSAVARPSPIRARGVATGGQRGRRRARRRHGRRRRSLCQVCRSCSPGATAAARVPSPPFRRLRPSPLVTHHIVTPSQHIVARRAHHSTIVTHPAPKRSGPAPRPSHAVAPNEIEGTTAESAASPLLAAAKINH